MRLLFLTPGCFDKGGISRYCRYQISALRDLFGQEAVGVFSVHGPDASSFETPFEVVYSGRGPVLSTKLEFVARASAWAARHRPDAILSAHVNLSGYAEALGRALGVPTLLNVYGLEVWSPLKPDARFGLRRAQHLIADCHFTADYLEAAGIRQQGSTHILWDCVDTSRFFPARPRPEVLQRYGIPDPGTGFNLVSLGRMSWDAAHKGYERLLDVFTRVAGDCPQLRLIYGGGGSMVEELRRRARERDLGHRVFFTGRVHEDHLADVYRSAHLFSLVSDRGVDRGEGLPLTPLEAAACQVPILVGNQDGSREAVVGEENGYVLDPFDLDAHAERVRRLYHDPALRHRQASAARDRISRFHSYEVFRDKLAEHLRSMGVTDGR